MAFNKQALFFGVIAVIIMLAAAADSNQDSSSAAKDVYSKNGSASSPRGNSIVQLAQAGLLGRNAVAGWFPCPYPCNYLGCNEYYHRYCYCSNINNCGTCVCLA